MWTSANAHPLIHGRSRSFMLTASRSGGIYLLEVANAKSPIPIYAYRGCPDGWGRGTELPGRQMRTHSRDARSGPRPHTTLTDERATQSQAWPLTVAANALWLASRPQLTAMSGEGMRSDETHRCRGDRISRRQARHRHPVWSKNQAAWE
jgi:hypothetical protein